MRKILVCTFTILFGLSLQAWALNSASPHMIKTEVTNCSIFKGYFKFTNQLSDKRSAIFARVLGIDPEIYGVSTTLPTYANILPGDSPVYTYQFVDADKAILSGQVVVKKTDSLESLCGVSYGCYFDPNLHRYISFIETIGALSSCNLISGKGTDMDPYQILLK